MCLKKKKKLTDEDLRVLERLRNMEEYVRQLQSDLNYGVISEFHYKRVMMPILEELTEMERARNIETFDKQMGNPMDFLDTIFFNKTVHDAIEEVDNDRAGKGD